MEKPLSYHQGDVFLVPLKEFPKGERKLVRRNNVAFGEVTGHVHVIEGCEVYEIGGREFLVLKEEKPMMHEEHPAIPLIKNKGIEGYEIRIQQEYFPEGLRNVAD